MMRATIGLTLGALGTLALLTGMLLVASCGQLAPAADDLPVVTAYFTEGCVPCATAKLELAAAKKLPCRIVTSLRAAERIPRVVFVGASYCPPCKAAINGPQSFPVWLRDAGWKVGHSETDHVQVVDADSRPELVARYGVTSFPTMVRITADGPGKPIPYCGRGSLVTLLAATWPEKRK